jgi:hypothetical protein
MASPARHVALEALRRVSRGGTTLDTLDRLEARLRDSAIAGSCTSSCSVRCAAGAGSTT